MRCSGPQFFAFSASWPFHVRSLFCSAFSGSKSRKSKWRLIPYPHSNCWLVISAKSSWCHTLQVWTVWCGTSSMTLVLSSHLLLSCWWSRTHWITLFRQFHDMQPVWRVSFDLPPCLCMFESFSGALVGKSCQCELAANRSWYVQFVFKTGVDN